MFVNKHFINTDASISKNKRCYNLKSSAYCFYMRKEITLNFRICISVPLTDGTAIWIFIRTTGGRLKLLNFLRS